MIHKELRRRGAQTVEAALVAPVAFFLFLGLIVGGLGVFRYSQTAHIARETARFAAVHGGRYAKDNAAAITAGTLPAVDENYLVTNVARPIAATMDPNRLHVSVSMLLVTPGSTSPATIETVDWDDTNDNQNRLPYSVWTDNSATPPANVEVTNVVIVTVTYQWSPEVYLIGPITLTSTAEVPMSY